MIKLLIMRISRMPPCPMSVHTDPRIASAFSEGLFRAESSLYVVFPGAVARSSQPQLRNGSAGISAPSRPIQSLGGVGRNIGAWVAHPASRSWHHAAFFVFPSRAMPKRAPMRTATFQAFLDIGCLLSAARAYFQAKGKFWFANA
jgi:hypothetical protein